MNNIRLLPSSTNLSVLSGFTGPAVPDKVQCNKTMQNHQLDPFLGFAKLTAARNKIFFGLQERPRTLEEIALKIGQRTLQRAQNRFGDIRVKELNPITQENMEKIRKSFLNIEYSDESVKEMENLYIEIPETPEEMYEYIKQSLLRGCWKEGRNIFNYLHSFYKATIPESSSAEARKIETEIRALGVGEVKIADDIEQGRLIKDSLEELKKSGAKLPDSIFISDLFPASGFVSYRSYDNSVFVTGGYTFPTFKNGLKIVTILPTTKKNNLTKGLLDESLTVGLASNSNYKELSVENKEKVRTQVKKLISSGMSTNSDKHCIRHEIAHVIDMRSNSGKIINTIQTGEIPEQSDLSSEEMEIAESLSVYSGHDPEGSDFKAEAFAKLMNGEQLTETQEKLYKKLNGFFPDLSWK